jgi:hypothetical protein
MIQANPQKAYLRQTERRHTERLRLLQVVNSLAVLCLVLVSTVTAQQIGPDPKEGSGTPSGDSTSMASICPVRLIGKVEDIDGSGTAVCRYQIFVASDCRTQQYRIDLPCYVNRSDCQNGVCSTPTVTRLIPVAPPDPNTVPEIPGNPMPMPQPIVDPVTIPGYDKAFAASTLATGLAPLPANSSRSFSPIAPRTQEVVKYARYSQNGVNKFFQLFRVEVTEADGSKLTIGTGFEIPAIPDLKTPVPTVFRPLQNKTYQVEEYSNEGAIVWTYIVHENQ